MVRWDRRYEVADELLGGGVDKYQRIVIVTFKDDLSKASMTSYLHPIIKQQGEAHGLIAMTSTQITELSILTTYLWPDYETAKAAREE